MAEATVLLWFSYCRWRPWGSERLRNLPQITKPASDEVQITSQVKRLQRLCFAVAPWTSISISIISKPTLYCMARWSLKMQTRTCPPLPQTSFMDPSSLPVDVSVQFSSVAQSCPTLCDPMDCSSPGLSVHHQLPEFTQTHVHRVGDAIQPSHSLSSPSLPAFNLSQHQGLFKVEVLARLFTVAESLTFGGWWVSVKGTDSVYHSGVFSNQALWTQFPVL